ARELPACAGAALPAGLFRARDGPGAQPERGERQGPAVSGAEPGWTGAGEDVMNDDPEQLDKHVEDLLQDRKPERTPLGDEDALRARQTAAMLRAAKPGAGLPSKEFLERMQGSIKQWVGEQSARPQPAARPSRRALLLTGAAGIAAGVAAVVGIEQLTEPAPKTARPLVENGSWKP